MDASNAILCFCVSAVQSKYEQKIFDLVLLLIKPQKHSFSFMLCKGISRQSWMFFPCTTSGGILVFLRKNISPLVVPPPAAPAAGAKDAGPSAVP